VKIVDRILTKEDIFELRGAYGDYIKLTVDLEKEQVVVGGELHADGEKVLLEKGSQQDNVWGGGINLFESSSTTRQRQHGNFGQPKKGKTCPSCEEVFC